MDNTHAYCFTYAQKGVDKADKKPTVVTKVTFNWLILEENPLAFVTITFFRVTPTQSIIIIVAETTCAPSGVYFLNLHCQLHCIPINGNQKRTCILNWTWFKKHESKPLCKETNHWQYKLRPEKIEEHKTQKHYWTLFFVIRLNVNSYVKFVEKPFCRKKVTCCPNRVSATHMLFINYSSFRRSESLKMQAFLCSHASVGARV